MRTILVAVTLLIAIVPCQAASIPAWLDDAISEWNAENPQTQISFVDIKDSFVWYAIPHAEDIGHQDIRENVYGIVLKHGYKVTAEEELITTGKPPTPTAPYKEKKCWRRSFVLDIEALSNTTAAGSGGGERPGLRQRMLTSLVCQDVSSWFAGFRVLE